MVRRAPQQAVREGGDGTVRGGADLEVAAVARFRKYAGMRAPPSSTQSTSRMSSARLRSYIAAYIRAALAKAGWSVTSATRSLPI